MTDDLDQKIWSEIRLGKESAFDQLFRKYYRYLVSIGIKYGFDTEISKDIAQEVFADLWNRKENIKISHSLKFYLRKAVINNCLSRKRKSQRIILDEEKLLSNSKAEENTIKQIEGQELKVVIDIIIEGLPQRCKEVFKLSRYENLSHKEIAEKLNISTKTIENQMTKALKTLRSDLKKQGFLSVLKILFFYL